MQPFPSQEEKMISRQERIAKQKVMTRSWKIRGLSKAKVRLEEWNQRVEMGSHDDYNKS